MFPFTEKNLELYFCCSLKKREVKILKGEKNVLFFQLHDTEKAPDYSSIKLYVAKKNPSTKEEVIIYIYKCILYVSNANGIFYYFIFMLPFPLGMYVFL